MAEPILVFDCVLVVTETKYRHSFFGGDTWEAANDHGFGFLVPEEVNPQTVARVAAPPPQQR